MSILAAKVPLKRRVIVQQQQLTENGNTPRASEYAHWTRLKLESVRFDRTPSGRCSARVELKSEDGSTLLGMAEGNASAIGELRMMADATLRALRAWFPGTLKFEILGVKPLRVFDANIVIIAVGMTNEDGVQTKLIGSDLADADPIMATAKAVLNATNRIALKPGAR